MPTCGETFSIVCNTLTAGTGLGFVGFGSFVLQKHYIHEIIVSPAITEAFFCLSFGSLLIATEIILNSVWCFATGKFTRKSKVYRNVFITAAVWKLMVCIVELCVGLLLFTPAIVRSEINETMADAFNAYTPGQPNTTERVDHFQHDLQCCGLENYKYWFNSFGGNDVTPGCCKDPTIENCYKNLTEVDILHLQDRIYIVGCYEAYIDSMADSSITAIVLFYIVAILLVLASVSYIINVVLHSSKYHEDIPDHAFTPAPFKDANEREHFLQPYQDHGDEIHLEPIN